MRRCFALAFLLAFLFARASSADKFTLRIIAINDFHGNLESPGEFRENPGSPEVPVGGIDFLAGYVRGLKSGHPNNVVVAAGDLIGASPCVSALFHDEGTIETLNRLGLEISSVGNHEFDKGELELLRLQKKGCSKQDDHTCQGARVGTPVPFEGAKFKYLAANVFNEATGKTILPPYWIKTYAGGVRVAFIGLTLKDTPTVVIPENVAGLRFEDEATTINGLIPVLRKKYKVQAIVVLIHEGGRQATRGSDDINACEGGLKESAIENIVSRLDDAVDLVISGHTHAPYICRISNRSGRKIPVTSAAYYGKVLTSIDVTIDTTTKKVVDVTAKNVLVDRTNAEIKPDAGIQEIVKRYVDLAAPLTNRVVGTIAGAIKSRPDPGESALGDLIADAQLEYARRSAKADVAFMNPGGIRTDLPYSSGIPGVAEGKVTYGELCKVQPFGNGLITMTLTGMQIKTLLEQQFKGCDLDFPPGKSAQDEDRILQVSQGFSYSWSREGEKCRRIDRDSVKIGDKPVVDDQPYRVATNSFLAFGGDKFYEFIKGTGRVGGGQDLDALEAYFAQHALIEPKPPERIKVSQKPLP